MMRNNKNNGTEDKQRHKEVDEAVRQHQREYLRQWRIKYRELHPITEEDRVKRRAYMAEYYRKNADRFRAKRRQRWADRYKDMTPEEAEALHQKENARIREYYRNRKIKHQQK